MTYLYAIAEAPATIPVDGLRAVERAGLAALVGDPPDGFMGHQRAVEALMAVQPVLPARFGSTFAADDQVGDELETRAASFRERLAAVHGCVELSVHANAEPALSELARDARRLPGRDGGISTAYLVPVEEVPRFRARVEKLDHCCTGPWPPYSFVDAPAPSRINADPESVEKGLVQLVLTIVELLRQLMERQALHRIDAGGLDAEQIERLDRTFMLLEQRMEELREHFGLEAKDLNLDLGPLGRLL